MFDLSDNGTPKKLHHTTAAAAVGVTVFPSTCGVSVGAQDCAGTTAPPPRHRSLSNTVSSGSDKIDTVTDFAALFCLGKGTSQATPNAASNVDVASLSLPDSSKASTHPPLHPLSPSQAAPFICNLV